MRDGMTSEAELFQPAELTEVRNTSVACSASTQNSYRSAMSAAWNSPLAPYHIQSSLLSLSGQRNKPSGAQLHSFQWRLMARTALGMRQRAYRPPASAGLHCS
jgi:hypothetical protein